ncbi:hypothetical protein HY405_00605 [Candidatus Microgenomates bacterium]|nr:hypothetical protein [Candidatus Microgenomates bacterium]
MDPDLAQQAIRAAVEGNWQTAERLNRTILRGSPDDIDALLRLAHALAQLGKAKEAVTHYEKVLRFDRFNIFATRGLSKLRKIKKDGKISPDLHDLETMFLEEPGKTKTASLVHIASAEILAQLDCGQRVLLVPRRHRISVTTESGAYIGRLPDDLSVRLFSFMSGGNKYEAVIKSASGDSVKIFVREIFQAPKFKITPSFSPDASLSHFDSDN